MQNLAIGETSRKEKTKVWNVGNKEGWAKFNRVLDEEAKIKPPATYDELENLINRTLNKTIGKVTITKGQAKVKDSDTSKKLKNEKKLARKEFNKACQNKTDDRATKLEKYINIQKQLREEYERLEKNRVEGKIETIIKEGGINSKSFWNIRKNILKGNQQADYDLITEEGKTVEDPEKAKEYISFENLYQAREGTIEYERWTKLIKSVVKGTEREQDRLPAEKEFTMKELNKAIKSVKRGKAVGPDEIPNEVFLEADEKTRKIYLESMNRTLKTRTIPEQWLLGNIVRLYKGKGQKGKCSNERGITLASNMGKIFERMVNNRAVKLVNMSNAQAGGKKGAATVDHILVLKDLIRIGKDQGRQVYLVFLDVTKAYDKAWLDAIMYVMHKQGLTSSIWTVIKRLNENLSARIVTKHGMTRPIKIRDSIRQGGVLSVLQYALLID